MRVTRFSTAYVKDTIQKLGSFCSAICPLFLRDTAGVTQTGSTRFRSCIQLTEYTSGKTAHTICSDKLSFFHPFACCCRGDTHWKHKVTINGTEKCDFNDKDTFRVCLQEVSRDPTGTVAGTETGDLSFT
jgi:hypothetical protein